MGRKKVKHECSNCGFEAILFESGAGYECPICKLGTLRGTPNVIGPSEVKHGAQNISNGKHKSH